MSLITQPQLTVASTLAQTLQQAQCRGFSAAVAYATFTGVNKLVTYIPSLKRNEFDKKFLGSVGKR